jgi:hypothetical protein
MLVLLILISLLVGCIENNENEMPILTVIFNDYKKEYAMDDIESFQSYTSNGRFIKTKLLPDSIVISESVEYTGVNIIDILEDITNLTENYNISVFSSDDRVINFTKDEIFGNVDIYDEEGIIVTNLTPTMILAYKEDGNYYSEIDPDNDIGPLRVALVGDNIITSSNLWSKMVIKIEIFSI